MSWRRLAYADRRSRKFYTASAAVTLLGSLWSVPAAAFADRKVSMSEPDCYNLDETQPRGGRTLAQNAMKQIGKYTKVPTNLRLCEARIDNNSFAKIENVPSITYDRVFLDALYFADGDDSDLAVFIFAWNLSSIFNGQVQPSATDAALGRNRLRDVLENDRFAGYILGKAGRRSEQVERMLTNISDETYDGDEASISQRLAVFSQQWERGHDHASIANLVSRYYHVTFLGSVKYVGAIVKDTASYIAVVAGGFGVLYGVFTWLRRRPSQPPKKSRTPGDSRKKKIPLPSGGRKSKKTTARSQAPTPPVSQ